MNNVNISLAYNSAPACNKVNLSVVRRESVSLSAAIVSSINLAISVEIIGHVALDPMIFINMDKYRIREIDNIVFDY